MFEHLGIKEVDELVEDGWNEFLTLLYLYILFYLNKFNVLKQ